MKLGGFGSSVIARLTKTSVKKNLYYEIKEKTIEESFDGVRVNKRKAKVRVYGLDSTKAVRADLIDLLYERVRYHKDKFISPIIHHEMETMEVKKRTGKVEHADGAHDDQVFSYLMAMYVLYNGTNLMENWGIQRNTIKTDEDKEFEESLIESDMNSMEKLDAEVFEVDVNEDPTEEDRKTKEFFEKNAKIKSHDQFVKEQEANERKLFADLLETDPNARKAYDTQYNLVSSASNIGVGLTTLPDSAFLDEENPEAQEIALHGNLFSAFMKL